MHRQLLQGIETLMAISPTQPSPRPPPSHTHTLLLLPAAAASAAAWPPISLASATRREWHARLLHSRRARSPPSRHASLHHRYCMPRSHRLSPSSVPLPPFPPRPSPPLRPPLPSVLPAAIANARLLHSRQPPSAAASSPTQLPPDAVAMLFSRAREPARCSYTICHERTTCTPIHSRAGAVGKWGRDTSDSTRAWRRRDVATMAFLQTCSSDPQDFSFLTFSYKTVTRPYFLLV